MELIVKLKKNCIEKELKSVFYNMEKFGGFTCHGIEFSRLFSKLVGGGAKESKC